MKKFFQFFIDVPSHYQNLEKFANHVMNFLFRLENGEPNFKHLFQSIQQNEKSNLNFTNMSETPYSTSINFRKSRIRKASKSKGL